MSSSGNPLRNIINELQLGETIYGTMVAKATQPLPQSATATLFTVQSGAVLVTGLFGIVTTAIQNQANNLSLGLAPTVGTAGTAGIGGPTSIQNLALGNIVAAPASAGAGGTTLVAPSVPASTVSVTNNYHGTVDVAVSGGTVTAVFVNGTQVASGTGVTVAVPAHGQISVTYSVAPTWTWTGSVALEVNANGTLSLPKDVGFVAPAGTITWTTSASSTGAMKWYCSYVPIDGVGPKPARVI